MDDLLVEIDTAKFGVARHFVLSKGKEAGIAGSLPQDHHKMAAATCSPTWAQPSTDGKSVYVACNKADEIVEVATDSWTLRRRIPAGSGVYNLAVSKDGKMVATTDTEDGTMSPCRLKLTSYRKLPSGVMSTVAGKKPNVTCPTTASSFVLYLRA